MNIITGHAPDSRPDHMTSDGDRVSHDYTIRALDHDGKILRELVILCRMSGAIGVRGNIAAPEIDVMIDNAKDAVNAHRMRPGKPLSVPGKDVAIPGLAVHRMTITGPIEEREYTIAVLECARKILLDMHAIRAAAPTSDTNVTAGVKL